MNVPYDFVLLADEQVVDVVDELKTEVDAQRHKVRSLEREMKQKNVDIEAVRVKTIYTIYYQISIIFCNLAVATTA